MTDPAGATPPTAVGTAGAGVGKRALWTLVAQALSSASSFSLSAVVLVTASRNEFAEFSAALVIYLVVVQLGRAFVGLPVLVAHSGQAAHDAAGDDTRACTTTIVAGGGLSLAVAAIAAAGWGSATGGRMLGLLAAALPFLLLQDTLRHVAFARGTPALAAKSEITWLVLQAVGSALAFAMEGATPLTLFGIWAGAGALSVWIAVPLDVVARVGGAGRWVARQWPLSSRSLGEFCGTAGSYYLLSFALVVVDGAAELGRFRAAQTIIGPASVLLLAGNVLGIPESVRRGTERQRLRAFTAVLAGVLAAAALLCGAAAYTLVPQVGPALFPGLWRDARALLPSLSLFAAALGVSIASSSALRALGDARWLVRARAIASAVALTIGLPATAVMGAQGALVGLGVAECHFAAAAWRRIRRATASADGEPPIDPSIH